MSRSVAPPALPRTTAPPRVTAPPPRVTAPPRPPSAPAPRPAATLAGGTPPPTSRATANLRTPVATPREVAWAAPSSAAPSVATPLPAASAAPSVATPLPAASAAPSPVPVQRVGAAEELVAIDEQEHAIEAVAMLGDSVVSVKHCAVAARRRLDTKALFAIAAAALVVAAAAFAISVAVAADNHAARQAWVGELGRPLFAFRARTLGPIYDFVGFGALGLAIAAFAAGLWRRERTSSLFRLGTATGVELPVAAAPRAELPIVAERGGRLVISTTRELGGELVGVGAPLPITDLIARGFARQSADGKIELPMPRSGQVRLRCGTATVLLSTVRRPAKIANTGALTDRRLLAFGAASAVAHLVLWGITRITPVEAAVATFDLQQIENVRTVGAASTAEDPNVERHGGSTGEGDAVAAAAAMKLTPGKAGHPDAEATQQRRAVAKAAEDHARARAEAIALAQRSGLLGSAAARDWTYATTGSSDINSGLDATDIYGEIDGETIGGSLGDFGNGRDGHGVGGDGFSNTIGSRPGYNTIGDDGLGDGVVGGCRIGSLCRGIGPGGRTTVVPGVRIGQPSCGANGCPDKEIIRRYMKRAIAKITYCYEKELLGSPELDGTVEASFVIAPNGTVMSSTAQGLSEPVSKCVAGVISTISFPAMNSMVQVRYPFVFRRAG